MLVQTLALPTLNIPKLHDISFHLNVCNQWIIRCKDCCLLPVYRPIPYCVSTSTWEAFTFPESSSSDIPTPKNIQHQVTHLRSPLEVPFPSHPEFHVPKNTSSHHVVVAGASASRIRPKHSRPALTGRKSGSVLPEKLFWRFGQKWKKIWKRCMWLKWPWNSGFQVLPRLLWPKKTQGRTELLNLLPFQFLPGPPNQRKLENLPKAQQICMSLNWFADTEMSGAFLNYAGTKMHFLASLHPKRGYLSQVKRMIFIYTPEV